MNFSIGNHNASPVSRAEIQSMDLEQAFLLVNHRRLDNIARVLKDQIADVQEKNNQLAANNELMSLARSVLAKFDPDAKNDVKLPEGPELDAFKQAAGVDADGIANKGELTVAIENFKSKGESLIQSQQIAMLRVQTTTNAYQETITSITNFHKSTHDIKSSILQKTA